MRIDSAYRRIIGIDRERAGLICDARQTGTPIVFASESFARHTGYPIDEVLGRNCRFLQGPDTDPAHVEAIRQALRTFTPITLDIRNYRKDGTAFWNRISIRPIRATNGTVESFAAVQVDVDPTDVRTEIFDSFLA